MQRKNVVSSNLKSVGYDEDSNILEIEFLSGGIYQYFNVPHNVHAGLMNASSHGTYFDRSVKKAGFKYKRLR
jgi:hypothetical protein